MTELTQEGQPIDRAIWLSITALAKRQGRTKQAISKRLKKLEGAVSVRIDGAEKLVNVVEWDRAVRENSDPSQVLRNPALELDLAGTQQPEQEAPAPQSGAVASPAHPSGGSYAQSRAARESYDAESARLDLLERLEKTCDRAEAEARSFAVFRQLRDRLLALPSTIAARMHAADDTRAARSLMEEELRKLLEQFADRIARGAELAEAEADGMQSELIASNDVAG